MKYKEILFAGLLLVGMVWGANAQTIETTVIRNAEGMFVLPPMPYPADALAPVIGAETMNLHYGKHFQGYIDNLNRLIAGTPFEQASLPDIVAYSSGAVFNNAAQALNHDIYFNTFSSRAKRQPSGALLKAIEKEWGSPDAFKQAFEKAANGIFGSGWAWLAQTPQGGLVIMAESNAGNPLTKGYTPLLGVDVWEHAYYLDYRNRRADHLKQLWSIIDWEKVESRYKSTGK